METDNNINKSVLIRFITGNTTEKEAELAGKWINVSDENRKEFEALKDTWEIAGAEEEAEKIDVESAWNNVKGRLASSDHSIAEEHTIRTHQKSIYYYLIRIAAVLLIGFAAWYLLRGESALQKAVTENNRLEVVLPDGSQVFLNSNTELQYPEVFSSGKREVELLGEAYFTVAEDQSRPFIIKARNARIEVVGTAFNVRATKHQTVEVIVNEGKVLVYYVDGLNEGITVDSTIILPGEKGTLEEKENSITKEINTNINFLSWKTGIYQFNETRLKDVVALLSDNFQVEIVLTNSVLYDCRLTSRFENQPVDLIIEVISLTFGLERNKDGNVISLSGKGCLNQ